MKPLNEDARLARKLPTEVSTRHISGIAFSNAIYGVKIIVEQNIDSFFFALSNDLERIIHDLNSANHDHNQ